jgi:hypothetical protein
MCMEIPSAYPYWQLDALERKGHDKITEQTPRFESESELYRPSDRRLSAKLVPTFAGRRCHVVSVTDLFGSIPYFLFPTHTNVTIYLFSIFVAAVCSSEYTASNGGLISCIINLEEFSRTQSLPNLRHFPGIEISYLLRSKDSNTASRCIAKQIARKLSTLTVRYTLTFVWSVLDTDGAFATYQASILI